MTYGGLNVLPETYGGARPTIEILLRSLNGQMGTALDTSPGSPIFYRNLALAMCIADVWDSSERMSKQFDPTTMTEFLPRWERIFGIVPGENDTLPERRARIQAKYARLGRMPTAQAIGDQISRALGPITFTVIADDADSAEIAWPYAMGRVYGLGVSPPAVTVTGVPAGTEQLRLVISTPGTLGVAQFQWSLDNGTTYSAPVLTAASFPIPGSTLTLQFPAGTYDATNVYFSSSYSDEWSSTTARISVICSKPASMSFAEYRRRIGDAWVAIDDYAPAWLTFNFGGGLGFILDTPGNLDNLLFDE